MATHLGQCNFLPGTAAKRFAWQIAARATGGGPEISERESAYLRGLVYTFRRQIPAEVVALAGDVPAQRRNWKAQQQWRNDQVAIAEITAAPAPCDRFQRAQQELAL